MTRYEIPESPDWTPDNSQRPEPFAASEPADYDYSSPAVAAQQANQRRWTIAGAALMAALLVGAVGGVSGAAVISQHGSSTGLSSLASAPAAGTQAGALTGQPGGPPPPPPDDDGPGQGN